MAAKDHDSSGPVKTETVTSGYPFAFAYPSREADSSGEKSTVLKDYRGGAIE